MVEQIKPQMNEWINKRMTGRMNNMLYNYNNGRLGVSLQIEGRVRNIMALKPEDGILRAADEENAEMIVVGCRGRGALQRTFGGSVSDYLVHHAPCPVVVCKRQHKSNFRFLLCTSAAWHQQSREICWDHKITHFQNGQHSDLPQVKLLSPLCHNITIFFNLTCIYKTLLFFLDVNMTFLYYTLCNALLKNIFF